MIQLDKCHTSRADNYTVKPLRIRRHGVASILAMMFLVIFGSLAAVMAVVAHGNLRTAYSYMKVNRSVSAAETGITFAVKRVDACVQRFIVEKGTIEPEYGLSLWNGTWDEADGAVTILPPDGFIENDPATSIASAIINAHLADSHDVIREPGDELLPDIDEYGKVVTRPIAVLSDDNSPTFRLTYEPVMSDDFIIRITSVGSDGDLTRLIQIDYRLCKRLDAAIISPSRIMIGKNVHIDGPIGTRYGENPLDMEEENGHPMVLMSDFHDLDATLDTRIDALIDSITIYDVDADNRLRPTHPTESNGLTENYMIDYDNNGFVDDYDLWLAYYDDNEDNQIAYDALLALEAGYGVVTEEFVDIDDQLVELIDTLNPDRNGDGEINQEDVLLGYRDGVINALDNYSKVNGTLMFSTSASAWEAAQNDIDFQSVITGSLQNNDPDSPTVEFDVPDSKLYDLTNSDFSNSQTALKNATLDGLTFLEQLTAQLGENPDIHVWSDHETDPDYLAQDLNGWEQMPHESTGFYDWYRRPIYKNMTFVNVKIPMGNNGLFINCSFVGAIYIETYTVNEHINWNFLGMKEKVGSEYIDKYDYYNWDPPLVINNEPVYDTKPFSNNIRFHDCTIIGSIVTDPVTTFTHVRNKLQFTGNTSFTLDATEIEDTNLSEEEKDLATELFNEDLTELEKSSLLAPNFSVDVGNFTNSGDKVTLTGTIVAGVLDIRGSADVYGTLLMTYKPVAGEGVLYYGGSTASFNTTLGYFSTDEGDGEGLDPANGYGNITIRYNPDQAIPDGIMAPLSAVFITGTYSEGSTYVY